MYIIYNCNISLLRIARIILPNCFSLRDWYDYYCDNLLTFYSRDPFMITQISHFSLLVHNQDEAAAFYTEKLGFVVTEGHKAPDGTWYWLTLAPTKDSTVCLSLLLPQQEE